MWQGTCWYKMLWDWDFNEVKQPAIQGGGRGERASIAEETVHKGPRERAWCKERGQKEGWGGLWWDWRGRQGPMVQAMGGVWIWFLTIWRAEEGSDSIWFLFLKDHSGCGVCREVGAERIEAGGSGTAGVLSDVGDWGRRQRGTLYLVTDGCIHPVAIYWVHIMLWALGEGTIEDEMVEWHHRLCGHEFE